MNTLPPNEGRSWWLRESLALPEFAGEPCPPLDTDTKADVVMAVDRMGLSDIITVLSPDEVRRLVDSPVFHAGVLTKAGATVHPARLARGLRRVLLERGVRIHEGTHVSRFGAGDPAIAV